MNVTFTRTGERRYRVSIDGPGIESSYMEPAPGYDARLPHDAAHFIVESVLGIRGGVFGQLAAGGHARTFRRGAQHTRSRDARRGDRLAVANHEDASFSERAVFAATCVWKGWKGAPTTDLATEQLRKICQQFDTFSLEWSRLPVGGSVARVWNSKPRQRSCQPRRSR